MKNNHFTAFITVKQLADHIGITQKTVYRMVKRGELKCTRFGKSIRFSKDYIRELLDEK